MKYFESPQSNNTPTSKHIFGSGRSTTNNNEHSSSDVVCYTTAVMLRVSEL